MKVIIIGASPKSLINFRKELLSSLSLKNDVLAMAIHLRWQGFSCPISFLPLSFNGGLQEPAEVSPAGCGGWVGW